MPDPTFRGDPYRVLDVATDATGPAIKRRWRELAREHHPDKAAGDGDEAARLTKRMARINAAYDLLSDPGRRARFDASPEGGRARERSAADTARGNRRAGGPIDDRPAGPPPPPPTRPVTARFDMTALYRPRNTTVGGRPYRPPAHAPPRSRRMEPDELRASTPSGPVERSQGRAEKPPSLREARETELDFGRFRGYTLGEVALLEPSYIDWIANTITRDRDLVRRARVIQAELDREGVGRRVRPSTPGFGGRTATG